MSYVVCSNCQIKSKAAKNLSEEQLGIMEQSCVEVKFDKNDIIFKQDALSSNIIYIKEGLVKLIMRGPRRPQIIKLKKAPCYLGMPTTLGDKINHYSAVAQVPTTVCFIDIRAFKSLMLLNTDFSYDIVVELCRNELDHFNRCTSMVQNQVYGRLANNLLNIADNIYNSNDFDLPLSRNEMADLINTSRETISRIFSELKREGIIEIEGRHISIIDRERLMDISSNG